LRPAGDCEPQVLCCSALNGSGVDAVLDMVEEFRRAAEGSGTLARRRAQQNSRWLEQLTVEEMQRELRRRLGQDDSVEALETAVAEGRMSPLRAIACIREKLAKPGT
jgi:LAO/AO transport system kinase